MELISIEEVKQQCYIDRADVSEDRFIERLTSAAISLIEARTSRKIYAHGSVPQDDESGLAFTDDLKHAALMTVGYFYENREIYLDTRQERAFNFMIQHYRYPQV